MTPRSRTPSYPGHRFLTAGLLVALAVPGCLSADGDADGDPGATEPLAIRFDAAAFDPLVAPFEPAGTLRARLPAEGHAFALLQFTGPVRRDWKRQAAALGVVFHGYVPDQAFVVRLDAGRLRALRALPFVRWVGPFHPAYKLSSSLGNVPVHPDVPAGDPRHVLDIDVFLGEDLGAAADAVADTGAEVGFVIENAVQARVRALATLDQAVEIARIEAVRFVEERTGIVKRNDKVSAAVQSDATGSWPIWDAGLHGEGQVVGIIDGAIDVDHCFFDDGVAVGPLHRKIVGWWPDAAPGAYTDSHGSHTAGTLAGEDTGGTSSAYNGVAYGAKISFGDVDAIDGWGNTPSTLFEYLEAAWLDGARVHSNSWGEDYRTDYTTFAREADLYTWTYEDAMVVFSASNTTKLYTPENARNVLAIGATQDPPSTGNHYSGGTGPTVDGRRKPEVYAPGQNITSTNDDTTCGTTNMSGTSMAAPAITGAAALARQYFTEGWYPTGSPTAGNEITPSGALLRGLLAHSGRDMTGVSSYPSNKEGWGKLVLGDSLYFPGDARRLFVRDVRHASGLETGGVAEYTIEVLSGGQPLRVSLTWTDAYGTPGTNPALVDDLDLEVVAPEGTYLGNVIDTGTGESTLGGTRDSKNNMEHVILNPPTAGTYTLRVKGTNVPEGPQGFALIATGDLTEDGGGVGGDVDGDGFTVADGDCDDHDAGVYPGAVEVCNATDDDCDGGVDEGLVFTTWYGDGDGDGYGDPLDAVSTCDGAPVGTVAIADDCDDTRASVNPAAAEVCGNGLDDDCDGTAEEGCPTTCSISLTSPSPGGSMNLGRVKWNGDCDAYVLQVSSDSNFPDAKTHWYGTIAEAADTQTYSIKTSRWSKDGRYYTSGGYWRLVGVKGGVQTVSETRSFYTTKTALTEPTITATCTPTLVTPSDGSVITSTPTWDWGGDCAVVRLELSTDPAFPIGLTTEYYGRTDSGSFRYSSTDWSALSGRYATQGYWRVVGGATDGPHPTSYRTFRTSP